VPRKSAAEARATRSRIIDRAVDIASLDGLEGVTIGRLAEDLQMSKAGVIGHFRTKEGLQLAAVERAADIFRREVWDAAAAKPEGLPRLVALCDAWVTYATDGTFPGGCFFTAAVAEFDGRAGPVRDSIERYEALWFGAIQDQVRIAIDAGDLPRDTDPDQVSFELRAIEAGLNQRFQLHRDASAPGRARVAMRRVLGVT
jgi:AcrR family transcriptional regulator